MLGIYVTWLNVNYSYDSVAYAIFISKAINFGKLQLWHEYHMLHTLLGYLVGSVVRFFSRDMVESLLLMQLINSVSTGLYLFLFARLLYSLTRNAAVSLLFTMILGFSYGVWFYSTNAEVYPPAMLFSVLALWAFYQECQRHRWSLIVAMGIFAGLAAGFHIASGLLFPVLLAGLFGHKLTKQNVRHALSCCVVLSVIFFLTAFSPYMYYYHVDKGTNLVAGLLTTLHKTRSDDVDGDTWWLENGIQFGQEMRGLLRGFAIHPERGPVILTITAYVLQAFLLLCLAAIPFYIRSLWEKFGWMVFVAGGSTLVFFLFFSTYNVGSRKFVTFVHIPFLLLAGLAASRIRWSRPVVVLLSIVVVVLCVHNLYAQMQANSRIENNMQYAKSLFIKEHTDPDDLIIILGAGENIFQKVYLPYFGIREVVILDLLIKKVELSQERIVQYLNWKLFEQWRSGGRVFLMSEVLQESPFMQEFLTNRQLPADFFPSYFSEFSLRVVAAFDQHFKLYEVVPFR